MKNILLIILLSATSFAQVNQEWVAIYSSPINFTDLPKGIVANSQGDVFIACSLYASAQSPKGVIIKYNSSGQEEWVIPFGGEEVAFISDIEIDASGNIYVTGGTGPNLNNVQLTTIKYNSSGTSLWVNKYNRVAEGEDVGLAITLDQTGNVYVTGYGLTAATGSNYITIKYNASGVREWVKIFDDGARAIDICVDFSNNVYITGFSHGLSSSNNNYITVKYNQTGLLQWAKSYDGPGSSEDTPAGILVDLSGNVIVTGYSSSDYATIKYNPLGDTLWVNRYHGGYGTDRAWGIVVDDERSVYVTGLSQMASNSVTVTIKYDSLGNQQWLRSDNGGANAMAIDSDRNIYIVGSINTDYRTLKYNSNGDQIWVKTYSRPGISNDSAFEIVLDLNHNVYVAGFSLLQGSNNFDAITLKYSQGLNIISPQAGEKWIAGETDTIRWTGGQQGQLLDIEYTIDNGNSFSVIQLGVLAESLSYAWTIPNNLLSTKVKIRLIDVVDTLISVTSDSFRVKPYIITKVDANGDYISYDRDTDVWNFGNYPEHMWPMDWYSQFDYQGIDPFTNKEYPQEGFIAFKVAPDSIHPDWVSWVNTFGISACYFNVSIPVYSLNAILRWQYANGLWNGSCFGISASNALAFSSKDEFLEAYPSFPSSFFSPITVQSDTGVKRVVNELFAHQFGNPSRQATLNNNRWKTITPNETLNEVKAMLKEDSVKIRTLALWNNNGTGGHNILVYGLEQDETQKEIYYLFVYDNSNPTNTNALILIDTTGNSNQGTWLTTYAWTTWGGPTKLMLEIESSNYLTDPVLPNKTRETESPFILSENQLDIHSNLDANVQIVDMQGNITGFINDVLYDEIPEASPLIYLNGSETPPYGYSLPTDNYSVVLNEFEEDTVNTFFFTGNKSIVYERSGAEQTQTDRLFFDGGVSAVNPNAQSKTIKLLNLINETTQEKLAVVSSIELAQNDSVKIENPDSNKIKIISYGTAKNYDLELNYVTGNGLGRFGDFNIPLTANTSHTFVPVWTDLTNSELQVLVDIGNDGTIDDTLSLVNQVTGIGADQGSQLTPDNFNLAQNYPNPFNPVTTIQYSIPQRSSVTLKVFDVLGNEIATLINEEKERGVYSINFDASHLASGMYLYRLQAGNFVETKKMILLR